MKQPQQCIPTIPNSTGQQARSDKQKAKRFTEHIKFVSPFTSLISIDDEMDIQNNLEAPFQLDLPVNIIKISEVKNIDENE